MRCIVCFAWRLYVRCALSKGACTVVVHYLTGGSTFDGHCFCWMFHVLCTSVWRVNVSCALPLWHGGCMYTERFVIVGRWMSTTYCPIEPGTHVVHSLIGDCTDAVRSLIESFKHAMHCLIEGCMYAVNGHFRSCTYTQHFLMASCNLHCALTDGRYTDCRWIYAVHRLIGHRISWASAVSDCRLGCIYAYAV